MFSFRVRFWLSCLEGASAVDGGSAHTEQPLVAKGSTVDPEILTMKPIDIDNKFAIVHFLTQHGQFSKT